MNRSGDGLVRRNVVRDNSSVSCKENHLDDCKAEKDDSLEDGDSKETRLTLMEEVLLLGLKDKEVLNYDCICFFHGAADVAIPSYSQCCDLFSSTGLHIFLE